MWKALAIVFSLLACIGPAHAQSARGVLETYSEGPVWHMIYVRTAPGQREAYLDSLSGAWTRQVTLAEEMGFVLRHHVLTKWPASPDDWDVLIIEVFPNMAAYDSFWQNWAQVDARVLSDRRREGQIIADINAVRTTLGVQISREIFLIPPDAPRPGQDR